ncbi:hypothetical protein Poli38472_005254 [Pythium oligandrum]|uniref:Homologous recombination OB-fold protein OB-fold domain-containing protein n=1 Tax=Pythium oligandrum TaxID=41045 RepID=A0A8K1CH03_PYTOL|nr:hypothetical protein Poli38472_005254 [Pythium oligandrum]|eukprot:TMW62636.1 hypothetical protein Poli38472_005254 [Pythium oligandrum]
MASSDDDDWGLDVAVHDGGGDEADNASVEEEREETSRSVVVEARDKDKKKQKKSATTGKKRGRRADHDDDDFESQPSILKWMRPVPGPLHDVMKQQQAELQQSMDDFGGEMLSGRSNGHAVHISTVFDDGTWVDMCSALGLGTTPGELYGGVKMSSLRHTISHILEDDQSSPKIPRLLALIKSMRYVDEEIVAVLHDPTSEMEAYFHRDLVEQVGPALVVGTAIVLRQVSVFAPTDATIGGTQKRYLNVIPRNVERVFVSSTIAASFGNMVQSFNEAQAKAIEAEKEREAEAPEPEERPEHVFAHVDVRNTTNELSFISQRQVVQRHQPVRPQEGSNASGSADKDGQGSGLGRWQWQQLVQQNSNTTTSANEGEPRRPALGANRFKDLVSQHIIAKRGTGSTQQESRATQQAASSSRRVSFGETNETSSQAPTSSRPSSASTASASSKPARTITSSLLPLSKKAVNFADEDDDDDDDW